LGAARPAELTAPQGARGHGRRWLPLQHSNLDRGSFSQGRCPLLAQRAEKLLQSWASLITLTPEAPSSQRRSSERGFTRSPRRATIAGFAEQSGRQQTTRSVKRKKQKELDKV